MTTSFFVEQTVENSKTWSTEVDIGQRKAAISAN